MQLAKHIYPEASIELGKQLLVSEPLSHLDTREVLLVEDKPTLDTRTALHFHLPDERCSKEYLQPRSIECSHISSVDTLTTIISMYHSASLEPELE